MKFQEGFECHHVTASSSLIVNNMTIARAIGNTILYRQRLNEYGKTQKHQNKLFSKDTQYSDSIGDYSLITKRFSNCILILNNS